ncbi:NAD(P)H-dependent oxidoreductase [Abiotrophia sp.]|uniref:NAD(P)H-dependent oxidoreductase n=1 Tax=Abiotrophia sp. TaxID=76631 RepID=UPI001CAD8247|nr:NAD(P)H-dependent oxidoreductase [Abiotrophia sp.]MBF0941228.1 NAD(P)H-dependent oxidoreductase [Abiotrophia sp.]
MTPEAIRDLLKRRYACRDYDPNRKISDQDFHLILEAGQLSPSSYGFEPWHFLVIESESLKKALAPIALGAQKALASASHFVIILSRTQASLRYDAPYIGYMMREIQGLPEDFCEFKQQRFETFQKEDFDLLSTERATFDWASKQSYLALAQMMQVAALRGIDSLAMEGFNRQAVTDLLTERGLIDPSEWGVSVMVSFGYGLGSVPRKTRQSLDQLVTWVK